MLEPYQGPRLRPLLRLGRHVRAVGEIRREHTAGASATSRSTGRRSNPTTWRLCKMNLAIRGIDGNLGPHAADTFHNDLHPDLKADFILANPPFNISDWGGDLLAGGRALEVRHAAARQRQLRLGAAHDPPPGAAAAAPASCWPTARCRTSSSGEGEIRRAMVEADLVDCMVALPPQLFYNTQIPACLWFLNRAKPAAPARADALHRRPQTGHAGRPHAPRADATTTSPASPRPTTPGWARSQDLKAWLQRTRMSRLLQERGAGRDRRPRLCADAGPLRGRGGSGG